MRAASARCTQVSDHVHLACNAVRPDAASPKGGLEPAACRPAALPARWSDERWGFLLADDSDSYIVSSVVSPHCAAACVLPTKIGRTRRLARNVPRDQSFGHALWTTRSLDAAKRLPRARGTRGGLVWPHGTTRHVGSGQAALDEKSAQRQHLHGDDGRSGMFLYLPKCMRAFICSWSRPCWGQLVAYIHGGRATMTDCHTHKVGHG